MEWPCKFSIDKLPFTRYNIGSPKRILFRLVPFCVYLVCVATPSSTLDQRVEAAEAQAAPAEQQTAAPTTPAAETEQAAAAAAPVEETEQAATPPAPAAVPQPPALPLLSCNTCSEVLRNVNFVQCPSDPVHRFCLSCTKALVQRQIGSQVP